MSDEIDLGPWPVKTREPALRGYAVTLTLVPIPEQSGVTVTLEARRDAQGREGMARYFKVTEAQPYDALLKRDGNTAFYQVQNKLIDQMVAAVTDYDAANTPPVVEP